MINISDKILVGLRTTTNTIPDSSICPIGKSSGESKKMNKLRTSYKTTLELDNTPLPGFTLTKSTRQWSSNETYWTIIDPRGFKSAISSGNLESILHCTGITEGLIQEKCVWARENERITMVLIPTSSEDYIEAVKNTEILNNKVDKKSVKLGDKVLLQNKMEGIYLGNVCQIGDSHYQRGSVNIGTTVIGKRQIIQVTPGRYFYQSDLKILNIIESAEIPYTKDEAIGILRNSLESKHLFTNTEYLITSPTTTYRPSYLEKVKFITNNTVAEKDINYSYQEIDLTEARSLYKQGYDQYDVSVLMLEDSTGRKYLIDHPNSEYEKTKSTMTVDSFEVSEILIAPDSIKLTSQEYKSKFPERSYYSTSPGRFKSKQKLEDYTKYYRIIKHIKNEQFN